MAFKLNREQLEAENAGRLLPKGEYRFKVVSAEEKPNVSSSDGKMIALVLMIRSDNQIEKVKDWLGQWKNGPAKMLSFLDSVGVNAEDFTVRELLNRTGIVAIKHGEFNNKPQLQVDYYVPTVESGEGTDDGFGGNTDEDVPF